MRMWLVQALTVLTEQGHQFLNAKAHQGCRSSRRIGQVIAGTTIEPHPLAVLAGDYPEAIMLDFVQPVAA
jgi:hypothetical protein